MSFRFLFNRIYAANVKTNLSCVSGNCLLKQFATFDLNKTIAAENVKAPPKKKTPIIPKITLISPDSNITITTLEEAQKLSKRRDLKLVKIVDLDAKTERPVYKLMSGAEYYAEDIKHRAERKASKANSFIKGEKLLTIGSRISAHDLELRINNIKKWITKSYEVRVVINGELDNMSNAESNYTKMEDKLKETGARFLQKRQKGSDIRFQILPPNRDKDNNNKS